MNKFNSRTTKKTYAILLITISILMQFKDTYSQKWNYESSENEFDGKYKVGYIRGTGGEFPYQNPKLFVNYFFNHNALNIYISDAGYAGCDGKSIRVKFNKLDSVFYMSATTNSDSDVWFLGEDNYNSPTLSQYEFLQKVKKYSVLSIRLSSDCGQSDYRFSLSGSSAAIDFVSENYFITKTEALSLKQERNFKISQSEGYINSGMKVYAITAYDCSIFKEPNLSSLFKSLQKRERVIISKFNDDYFNIHSAVTIDFVEKTFYVKKDCILMDSIDLINKKE